MVKLLEEVLGLFTASLMLDWAEPTGLLPLITYDWVTGLTMSIL